MVWIPRILSWKRSLLKITALIPNRQPKPTINHSLIFECTNNTQFWFGILANGGWSHLQKVHSQTLTGAGTFTYICHENQNKKVGQYTLAPFVVDLALITSSFIKGSNSGTLPWNVEYCYWKHSTLELKQRAPCQENKRATKKKLVVGWLQWFMIIPI